MKTTSEILDSLDLDLLSRQIYVLAEVESDKTGDAEALLGLENFLSALLLAIVREKP